jgi:hypothetical protein
MDYLRPSVDIIEIWYTTDRRGREHQWAETLALHRRASLPVAKFGASDCNCRAHLFRFQARPSGNYFRRIIRRQHPEHGVVRILRPRPIRQEQPFFLMGARNSRKPALWCLQQPDES